MVNYMLGKIYKIVCNTTGLIYIGSTCEKTLARRLATHINTYTEYLKGKGNYMTSYKLLENKNYEIILIENCQCNNKDELHKQERFYVEQIECVNKYIPGRTNAEYNIDKKAEISANKKEYYIENKAKISIYKKEYREKNRELLRENARLYREKQKNKINIL